GRGHQRAWRRRRAVAGAGAADRRAAGGAGQPGAPGPRRGRRHGWAAAVFRADPAMNNRHHRDSRPSSSTRNTLGFTLVEVLVALAIVAIALMAGLQATSALTRSAARQTDVVLAHLCAENELVRVRLARQMPS